MWPHVPAAPDSTNLARAARRRSLVRGAQLGAAAGLAAAAVTIGVGLLVWPAGEPFQPDPTDAFHYYNETTPIVSSQLVYAIGVLGLPVGPILGLLFGPIIARGGWLAVAFSTPLAALLALPMGGFVYGLVEGCCQPGMILLAFVGATMGPVFWLNPSLMITAACAIGSAAFVRTVSGRWRISAPH